MSDALLADKNWTRRVNPPLDAAAPADDAEAAVVASVLRAMRSGEDGQVVVHLNASSRAVKVERRTFERFRRSESA